VEKLQVPRKDGMAHIGTSFEISQGGRRTGGRNQHGDLFVPVLCFLVSTIYSLVATESFR